MIGLIKKELVLVKRNFKSLIISFLLYLFYGIMFETNISFIITFMTLIICISSFSYDDFNNWHLYAISLTGDRKKIVRAKYIFSILLLIISSIITIIFNLIIGNDIVSEILKNNCIILFSMLCVLSVYFPFMFKYGSEKGRIVTMLTTVIVMGIYWLLKTYVNIEFLTLFAGLFRLPYPIILLIIVTIFISVSYIFSNIFYLKREF